jgi:hypothetical protein
LRAEHVLSAALVESAIGRPLEREYVWEWVVEALPRVSVLGNIRSVRSIICYATDESRRVDKGIQRKKHYQGEYTDGRYLEHASHTRSFALIGWCGR